MDTKIMVMETAMEVETVMEEEIVAMVVEEIAAMAVAAEGAMDKATEEVVLTTLEVAATTIEIKNSLPPQLIPRLCLWEILDSKVVRMTLKTSLKRKNWESRELEC